ncbi:MAG TPA: SLC13 family permease [Thermoanaerobaculia bacterium]|nr:SLC13 family permease [Thermoanaerobaculia bacterium]
MLQLIAAAIAVLFLVTGIVSPRDALESLDLELLLILFALLMTVEILRASGYLDLVVKSAVARFRTTRSFGFAMVMFSGVLAMFVTNDVALFVVIPFTVIASRFSDFDIEDAVVLEIIATNLIGCLTPLGNPQNLYVYHRSGWNAGEFIGAMLPFVAWCTAGLIAALFLLGPSHEMKRGDVALPARSAYAAVAGAVCLALVILNVAHAIDAWPAAIAAAIAWLMFLRKRVDLSIVPLFFFVFIIVAGLPALGVGFDGHVYFVSIALSQVISNVPATILLADSVDLTWIELLYGVSAGGCGTIIASLANLLGWRIYVRESNRDPRFFRRLTAINFAFLAWAAAGGWLLLKAKL